MSKSVRPNDFDWQNFVRTDEKLILLLYVYSIVRTDKIFKISPNDWHVQKDFNISAKRVFGRRDSECCMAEDIGKVLVNYGVLLKNVSFNVRRPIVFAIWKGS